ncbi:MAG: GTP-binding protein, partial [Tissierellia bacterium]|nr:GTP-binding protein [Tissierellia bacterium]
MRNIIIGTAGHIDHGKTTLIKALTGRETDRWEEEKRRGITIDLGFTYFDLPDGSKAGIIDVPGHEKFIKNMLAGVVGMDMVLLVIAADEGIMPQTTEHLNILNLLGMKNGIVVLTKCDIADEEWISLVKEDIIESLSSTFLEGAPIVEVSSKTRNGINNLIQEI